MAEWIVVNGCQDVADSLTRARTQPRAPCRIQGHRALWVLYAPLVTQVLVLRITGFWLVSCSLSFVWELWQGLVATHRIFSRFRGWEALFSGFAYSAVPVFELSTVSITLKSST